LFYKIKSYQKFPWGSHVLAEILSFSILCLTSVFFIVNPFSAAPVFLSLTPGWDHAARKRAALRSTLVALCTLVLFSLTGTLIFKLFGISIGAFRVAGGILLLRVAMDMLHGRSSSTKSTAADHEAAVDKDDISVSPMGIPQLAGPGAIATVILLPGEPRELWRIVPVLLAILVTMLFTYFALRGADRLQRIIGQSGSRIMAKVMGLLIAAVSMQFVATGVRDLIPLMLSKLPHP
jgi:multiple antibiotic resistance protein